MILIFKGFLEKAISLFNTENTNRKKIKYVSYIALVCGLVFTGFACAKVTVGFSVNYMGEKIAIVESREVIDNAVCLAADCVDDSSAKSVIETPKFNLTLTVADKFENASSVAETILENTVDITEAYALIVNGKAVAYAENDDLTQLLEGRRTAFYIDGASNEAKFVDEIETEKGLYLKSKLTSFNEIVNIINGLDVETVSVTETNVTIPYKTVKKTTSEKNAGYKKVETAGANGISVRTEEVKSLNGKVSTREEISNEVKTQAVDEVIVIGTGVKRNASSQVSSGFIVPLPRGKYTITSYYGDGRNHKALDFSADRGTSIYAVGGGTVTYAGYDSDFGYNVIIQHGNGIKTRYAHANSIFVKSGQVVSGGDVIATVGSTGWSTGNHLHFEVILNGVRVDPLPYLS